MNANHLVFCEIISIKVDQQTSINTLSTRRNGRSLLMETYQVLSEYSSLFQSNVVLKGGKQILIALEYIHKKGYVHMDVKGSNIFIDYKTGDWVLGDYGARRKDYQYHVWLLSS